MLIISFVGIYFAAKPLLYIEGLVTLVPPSKRERARELLGPLMAVVQAVLIAFSVSPTLALHTFGLFGVIQLIEASLVQPLIEQKTVALPPALTIVNQVLFGTLFELAGVALATPLTGGTGDDVVCAG